MGFKIPDKYKEMQKEIYDRKYITYKNEKIHVTELEDRSVTMEMKNEMRMNPYAQDAMPRKLTSGALVETTKYYLSHCSQPKYPCSTYDESLVHKLLPELLKRFNELLEENRQIKGAYDDRCEDIDFYVNSLREIDTHIRSTNDPIENVINTLKGTLPEYQCEYD